jgi:opacity protein-like surface antigen
MRRFVIALLLSAGIICTARAEPQSRWYIEGSAGALWRFEATNPSATFTNFGTGLSGPGTNTFTYDVGPAFNLGVGYRFSPTVRVEIEGGYGRYGFNTSSPLNTNGAFPALNGSALGLQSGGLHQQYSGTFNVFYDVPLSDSVAPYIGLGVGGQTTHVQTAVFANPPVTFTANGGSSSSALMMAEVGAAVALNGRWALVPAFRFEKALTNSNSTPTNIGILKLGVRYSLNCF